MNESQRTLGVTLRVILPIIIVIIAIMTFVKMKSMKKIPETSERKEAVRHVQVMTLKATTQTIRLKGYALIRSRTTIPISSEVGGRVVSIPSRLEDGRVVEKGSVLLKVDDRDVRNTLTVQQAERGTLEIDVKRLTQERDNLKATLELRKRVVELNEKELIRMERLFKSSGSVSQATVDAAEQRLVNSRESVLTLRQQLTQLPLRLESLKSAILKIDAQLKQSALTLTRCSMVAPITGRLKSVRVKQGQTVTPGQTLLTLVDDDDLIAEVDLPATEVVKWLPLTYDEKSNWLSPSHPIKAEVSWVDDPTGTTAIGSLERVATVDGTTRTVTLIFAIPKQSGDRRLFEGMFCNVSVIGKRLKGVLKIPRRAMTVDRRIPTMTKGRLVSKTAMVIAHQDEDVIIQPIPDGSGLQAGDTVITSPVQSLPDGHRVSISQTD